MPDAAHVLPDLPDDDLACDCGKGWKGAPKVPLDGTCWPLDFAAKNLDIPVTLLREVVKWLGLEPAGTINMRGFRSQGRIPRAYRSKELLEIYEKLRVLKEDLS